MEILYKQPGLTTLFDPRGLPSGYASMVAHVKKPHILGGLLKVAINKQDWEAALQSGEATKLDEIQQRFTGYIEKITRGKDLNKTRIVLG